MDEERSVVFKVTIRDLDGDISHGTCFLLKKFEKRFKKNSEENMEYRILVTCEHVIKKKDGEHIGFYRDINKLIISFNL